MNSLEIISDVNRQKYLAVDFNQTVAINFIQMLESVCPRFDKKCVTNLYNRNGIGKFHITVLSVPEMSKAKELDTIHIDISDIEIKGVGSLTDMHMETFFIVVESKKINQFRTSLGLKEKDLHVTIGFTHKDLFNGRKNIPNLIEIK